MPVDGVLVIKCEWIKMPLDGVLVIECVSGGRCQWMGY